MFFFLALWMFLNSGVSDEKGRSKSENKRLKKKVVTPLAGCLSVLSALPFGKLALSFFARKACLDTSFTICSLQPRGNHSQSEDAARAGANPTKKASMASSQPKTACVIVELLLLARSFAPARVLHALPAAV